MRGRRLSVLTVLAAAAFVAAASARAQDEPPRGTIRVQVVGLSARSGNIGCALFGTAQGFPGESDEALQKVVGRFGSGRTATCTFEDVPRGRYAISIGHDVNGNHRVDRNLLGIPTEGWGASNDAPARMGPPSFDDARFRFDGHRALLVITMRYGI